MNTRPLGRRMIGAGCRRGSESGGSSRARRSAPAGFRKDIAMRRIRYLVLAALGVFAALPVAQVYTSGAPWIQKMELRTNDLVALEGRGVPGTAIDIYYRQRNFKQGIASGGAGCGPLFPLCFEWCDWLNGGNAIRLGSAQATAAGSWRL